MAGTGQFYTYLHCKPDGTPFYVGKGLLCRAHKFSDRNEHHQRVVAKYGKDKIEVLVFPRDSERKAFDDEVKWIKVLREAGYELANFTDGGEGASGNKQSAETIAKKIAAITGKKRTPEFCAQISARNRGKIFSVETRAKMSVAAKARAALGISAETRAKLSIAGKRSPGMKGRKRSPEAIAITAAAVMGNTWNLGRKHSPETCAKRSKAAMGNKSKSGQKNPHSAATIAKMCAAQKARWARRKLQGLV